MKEMWSFKSELKSRAESLVMEYFHFTAVTDEQRNEIRDELNKPSMSDGEANCELIRRRIEALTGPTDEERQMYFIFSGTVSC